MDEGLHRERLDAVQAALIASGARTVADLGCGTGNLLARLLPEPQFQCVIGLDVSAGSLQEARHYLGAYQNDLDAGRLCLLHGSFLSPPESLEDIQAAALVETIEHVEPGKLGQLADAVWGRIRPQCIVVTTPNADYNVLFNMPEGVFRDPDHRFEWSRARFRRWAFRLAEQHRYQLRFVAIGEEDSRYGAPTQMAVFNRQ